MKLGEIGEKLVKLYYQKLQISAEEAMNIITKNETAKLLLKQELALSTTGINKNLSILMRITLLRKFYDFEPIRKDEVELIKKYYNIEIKNNL